MPHADFVHLRCHSAYSLAEGAIHIKQLAELAADCAMPALALTDTDNLFGALEFCEAMTAAGVQPIVGASIRLARRGDEPKRNASAPAYDRIALLVQDEPGYLNLLRLVSDAYLAGEDSDPVVNWDDLAAHSGGLIALSGGLDGPLGRLAATGQKDQAAALAAELAKLFPGRLYIELQRHGRSMEPMAEAILLDIAYGQDLPLVATNDVFFAEPGMYEAHDALLCIAEGATVVETKRRKVTPEHYFKTAGEMAERFADLPEAIANTVVVARRCAYRVPMRDPILPRFTDDDETALLRQMSADGLARRMERAGIEDTAAYDERLEFELKVIIEMGFAGYFLIVADFIQWAKHQSIPVGPGRGSGAGSVVAWALQITDLDPLRFNLLFERFLNPDRVSMPDFDIDFCQDRRDEVIEYVRDKYGIDQVAQIITFGKLQARAVLRDVGRVLGMPYGQIDRLCKLVPNNPANPVSLTQAIDGEPRLQEARKDDEQVDKLFDIAMRLEGLYRHASTHAAGIVIGDRPLAELVPLYRDPRSDMPVTQFNMKWVEQAGLVKFDFLGLKTLTVLDKCIGLLKRRGIDVALDTMPLDDEKTYQMLQRAEAVGVFQFESGGMRDLLREAVPTNIEDLIAMVALYRPGPMENIPKYVACKHEREQPEFLHETIEPVVADTYGVIIYQEQVMQLAQVFAGFTLGQADLLRRAMGKKIKSEMDAQRNVFIEGAQARGVAADRATYVFDLVDKFAGYGFNKAHSAGYGLVAYQTAYLKANYPVEFIAAAMTLDINNTDKLNVFRQEADRLDIELLPPDINNSAVEFSVEAKDGQGAIRYALGGIRNVGREAMRSLVAERDGNGAFADLWDFAGRLDNKQMNKRQMENLVRAGAFDALNPNRAQLVEGADLVLRYAAALANERGSDQGSLFGGDGGVSVPPPKLPEVPAWSLTDKLSHEFDAVGFYLSAHPLDAYKAALEKAGVLPYAEMRQRARDGTRFKLAGTVLSKQERTSARGSRFAFVQLSDPSGMFEIAVFAELLSEKRELLEPGALLQFSVDVRGEGDEARLTAQSVTTVEAVAAQNAGGIEIFVRDRAPLPSIFQELQRHNGHRGGPVRLVLQLADVGKEVTLELPREIRATAPVRAAIKAISGVEHVQDL
ncbi:MAG: DNA polymerase III subunit alpha [Alphaproteobacteria bacterium]